MVGKEHERNFNIQKDKYYSLFTIYCLLFTAYCLLFTTYSYSTQTYIVKKGDTLNSISQKFNVGAREIVRVNGIKNPNLIKVGKKLIIPRSNNNIIIVGNFTIHKVIKDETLEKIAKKYNTTVSEIKSLNDLTTDTIYPNELIVVPLNNKITNNKFISKKNNNIEIMVDRREKIVRIASRYLGYRYRFGGLDCSGFVRKVFKESAGIDLPHSSSAQFNIGKPVKRENLQKGDRVFFTTYRRGPSHVGIYIGGNKFIHASSHQRKIIISNLNEPYYRKRYLGARR